MWKSECRKYITEYPAMKWVLAAENDTSTPKNATLGTL